MTAHLLDNTRPALSDGPVRIGEIIPSAIAGLLSPDKPSGSRPRRRKRAAAEPQPRLTIWDLPNSERPRTRLVNHGAGALTTQELLSLIMGAAGGPSSLDVSRDVLAVTHGSIRRLRNVDTATLLAVPGVGPTRVAKLRAAIELSRRWLDEEGEHRPRVRSPIDIILREAPRMGALTVTEFLLVVLDTQHGIARRITLTREDSCSAGIPTRALYQAAIVEGAAAILLVHNHPNGDPSPSPEDHVMTQRLSTAGRLLDIPMYDHVIIGRDRYTSFLEENWL
jgi:DNA repair protein RadC